MEFESAEDLAAMFDCRDFADDCIYRPASGKPRKITPDFSTADELIALGRSGVDARVKTCLVRACELPDGVARNDRIVRKLGDGLTETFVVVKGRLDETGRVYTIELNSP
jgi:hypothetical protein